MPKVGKQKSIIVLLNLGGPADLDEVEPFLLSLLGDPYVIRLPWFMRPFQGSLAKKIVSKRLSKSQKLYSEIGGGSPLQEITNRQAVKLAQKTDLPTYVLMRHSAPGERELLASLEGVDFDRAIILPLYPQYSTTTTESSFAQVKKIFKKHYPSKELKFIDDYHDHELFVKCWSEIIERRLEHIPDRDQVRIIFSAHSIPESYVTKVGDPYQAQTEKSVELISANFPNNECLLTYQSKVGPQKWLEPFTNEYLESLDPDTPVLIVPISFVSEHVETTHEIGIQFREIAKERGLRFYRVPTPNATDSSIGLLAELVRSV